MQRFASASNNTSLCEKSVRGVWKDNTNQNFLTHNQKQETNFYDCIFNFSHLLYIYTTIITICNLCYIHISYNYSDFTEKIDFPKRLKVLFLGFDKNLYRDYMLKKIAKC